MFIPSFNPYNITKELSIIIIILFPRKGKWVTESLNNSLQSWTPWFEGFRLTALPMWGLDNTIPNIPYKKKFQDSTLSLLETFFPSYFYKLSVYLPDLSISFFGSDSNYTFLCTPTSNEDQILWVCYKYTQRFVSKFLKAVTESLRQKLITCCPGVHNLTLEKNQHTYLIVNSKD